MTEQRPPLAPEERYRMRRLTDDEMAQLIALARDGKKGPGRAIEALWDLILRDAEGVSVAEAAARQPKFRVQDYAIRADQSQQLYDAIMKGRRMPRGVINGFGMLWLDQSPCDYEPEDDLLAREQLRDLLAGAAASPTVRRRRSRVTDDERREAAAAADDDA